MKNKAEAHFKEEKDLRRKIVNSEIRGNKLERAIRRLQDLADRIIPLCMKENLPKSKRPSKGYYMATF